MELIELDVGELRTGTQGDCGAVARRTCRISCVQIHVPGSATRKDDGVGLQFVMLTAVIHYLEATYPTVVKRQIAGEGMFKHFDIGCSQRANERRLNRKTGSIALSMKNSRSRVGSL